MTYTPTEMSTLAILFSTLPLLAVTLRLWARRILKARLGADDYLVLVALVMCIAAGGGTVYGAIYGETGRHQDLGPGGEPILSERMRVNGKVKYTSQLLELLSFGTAKLSVLYLYRRIFAYPAFTRIANIFILVVVAWTIAFFFTILLQCVPVDSLWDMLDSERVNAVNGGRGVHCVNMMAFFYANSVSDVLLDVAILALPVPLVWGLRLGWRRKCAVAGMFALGGVVVLSSLIRLIIFIQFVPSLPQHSSDTTYYESPFSYWSHIEASLGVISACLPVLRPIFVRPSPHSNNSSSGGPDSRAMVSGSGVGGRRWGPDRSDLKDDFEKGNPFDDAHALPVSLAEKDLEIQPTDFSLDHHYPEGMESEDSLADSRSGGTGGRVGAPIVRKPVPQLLMERELPELPRLPHTRRREEDLECGQYERRERKGEMI
ncbi:hypothetical protein G7Y79_00006g017940 [Physcia stellaris]|nr:hypothetical protein G7Y79_00006g017940 [Physcia stellaris]